MLKSSMVALALTLSVPITAANAAPATPRAVVESVIDALNRHDSAALAALYSDDAVLIESSGCKPVVGAAAIGKHEAEFFATFPNATARVEQWVVSGDDVAVLFTGTLAPELPSTTIADFLTVKNGKIVRDTTIYNAGRPCS